MKYIITLIASIWLISCSEEFAAPSPPTIISGTVNNQTLDRNTVINLSDGDSLIIRLNMIAPNSIDDIRLEVFGVNDAGGFSFIDFTENTTLIVSPGDSIYTDIIARKVVNDLESLPRAVGSTTQVNISITMIDSEFLTARSDFKAERQ